MGSSLITVVIPARDVAAFLPWTLAGLAEQDYDGEWNVVVVDNASSDDTAAVADAAPVVSQVVRITGTGPADSRNAGVAASHGDRIAFLDADCRPTASWLSSGVRALEQADLVQGAVAPDPSATLGPFDRTLWVPRFTGLFETANLFVSREMFERVGGFQHWMGEGAGNARPFGEDVAFGWSARRL
ncbi:MAG TPA: glycosyltransferase family A protein, partial [Solirubrobacteraceae bacterium]|nr:glycosyltransferase family A protein [Solirubrobacteraceae bacterium]